jgi:hypothetical protein
MATQYALIEGLTHTVTATSYAVVSGSTQDLSTGDPTTLYYSVTAPTSHGVGVLLQFSSDTSFTATTEEYGLGAVPAGESRNWRWRLDGSGNDSPFSFERNAYYSAVRVKVAGSATTGGAVSVDSWLRKTE